MQKLPVIIYLVLFTLSIKAQEKPLLPVPSQRQLMHQNMEFYLFMHFGPNTFTDLEWGKGTAHEKVFNPTKLDCDQWCRVAKAPGAKGIIITAKHHRCPSVVAFWAARYPYLQIAIDRL